MNLMDLSYLMAGIQPTGILDLLEVSESYAASTQEVDMEAEEWHDDIKWKPMMKIKSSSYPKRSMFSIAPVRPGFVDFGSGTMVESGEFGYAELVLSEGSSIPIYSGSKRGRVSFDDVVTFPALYQRSLGTRTPWMSLTPMEFMSLRVGTKLAKGHTIVAGLGLGHQLIEVSQRDNVERITLIERSKGLVDWMMPRVAPYLNKPVDVIVGDVFNELPKITADVALIDIYPRYGNNGSDHCRLVRKSPNVKKMWSWGTAKIASRW